MSTPPGFDEYQTAQPAEHPHNGVIAGSNHGTLVAEAVRSERRRGTRPDSPEEHLHALPALILLDRLPIPVLATGLDGVIVYTNPAFATMLGHHPETITLIGKRLPELLAGQSETSPPDCVTALRANDNVVVEWVHAEGFPVRSVISTTLFERANDQILLISTTDITELIWTNPPESH